jgi:uncharacterized protein
MTRADQSHFVDSVEHLAALFGAVGSASLAKEVPAVVPCYRAIIEASPFVVLATSGPDGLDLSPRGDAPGFVLVEDATTLLLPERRGNNRIDSLRNIVFDPRVALLFLVPGAGETLRVNGRATITINPALLARCAVDGKVPQCVISIKVETVFFHCARAVLRSKLWQGAMQDNSAAPSAGAMLAALTEGAIDGARYDRDLPARQIATLY